MKHKFKQNDLLIQVGEDKRTNPRILELLVVDGKNKLSFNKKYYANRLLPAKEEFRSQLNLHLRDAGFTVYEAD